MMFAEQVVTFDATDVLVALLGAMGVVLAAFVAAGSFTKRNVKKGVEAATGNVSQAELTELQGIRSELGLVHTSLTASNNLAAQQWATMDRRVTLVEDRLAAVEAARAVSPPTPS